MEINEPYLLLEIDDKKFIFLIVKYTEDLNYKILDTLKVESSGVKNGKIIDAEISSKIIKENLNTIEKKNDFIFKTITIINNQKNFDCVNISGFKKLSGSQVSEEDISFILNDIKTLIVDNYSEKILIHLFNSNFILDNNNSSNLPIGLHGEFYCHHLTFFLLPKNDVKNIKLVLNKCDLEVERIILKPFTDGIKKINSMDKIKNFTLINIGNTHSSISIFEKSSLLYSQTFSFGTDILLKDVEKICSLEFIEVRKIFDEVCFDDLSNKNDNDFLDKKFFTSSKYRKISLTHLFDIIKARLNEITDLIYSNNINLKYLRKDNKSVFLSIEDPVIIKNLSVSFKKKLTSDNIKILEDSTQFDESNSCIASAELVGRGWEKEAIPIIHAKKSVISRIFSALFS